MLHDKVNTNINSYFMELKFISLNQMSSYLVWTFMCVYSDMPN